MAEKFYDKAKKYNGFQMVDDSGDVVTVPRNQIKSRLEGGWTLAPGQKIPVQGQKDGRAVTKEVESERFYDVWNKNRIKGSEFNIVGEATSEVIEEQQQQREAQAEASRKPGQTFAESAANILTIGGYSAVAEQIDPGAKEDIRRRQQANPKSAILGNLAGALVPGFGALKAAQAATKGMRAGSFLQTLTRNATAGAAENMAVQNSQRVLSNQDFSVEEMASAGLTGAMLGATLGTGIDVAGQHVGKLWRGLESAARQRRLAKRYTPKSSQDLVDKAFNKKNINTPETADLMNQVRQRKGLNNLPDEHISKLAKRIRKVDVEADDFLTQQRKLSKQFDKEVSPILSNPKRLSQELDAEFANIPNRNTAANHLINKIDEYRGDLDNLLGSSSLSSADKAAVKKISAQLNKARKTLNPDGFSKKIRTKPQFIQEAYGEVAGLQTLNLNANNKEVLTTIGAIQDDVYQTTTLTDVFGEVADIQRNAAETTVDLAKKADRISQLQKKELLGVGGGKLARDAQDYLDSLSNASEFVSTVAKKPQQFTALSKKIVNTTNKTREQAQLLQLNSTAERIVNPEQGNVTDRMLAMLDNENNPLKQVPFAGVIAAGVAGPIPGFALGAAKRPLKTIIKVGDAIESVNKRLLRQKTTLGELFKSGTRTTAISSTAKAISADALFQDREKLRERFDVISEQLTSLSTSPEEMVSKLSELTGDFDSVDPTLADALRMQGLQMFQYLKANLPASVIDPVFGDVISRPSDAEIYNFMQKYRAVSDPLSIMDQLVKGTLTIEEVEAVSTLYPKLYAEMSLNVLEVVSDLEEKPTYQQRLTLGTLFNVRDETLTPEFISAMQSNFAQTSQQAKSLGKAPGRPKEDKPRQTSSELPEQTTTNAQQLSSLT